MIGASMADHDKRDLVSIEDLSTAEILELFHHADEFRAKLRALGIELDDTRDGVKWRKVA